MHLDDLVLAREGVHSEKIVFGAVLDPLTLWVSRKKFAALLVEKISLRSLDRFCCE
jgi:hypothetical protein